MRSPVHASPLASSDSCDSLFSSASDSDRSYPSPIESDTVHTPLFLQQHDQYLRLSGDVDYGDELANAVITFDPKHTDRSPFPFHSQCASIYDQGSNPSFSIPHNACDLDLVASPPPFSPTLPSSPGARAMRFLKQSHLHGDSPLSTIDARYNADAHLHSPHFKEGHILNPYFVQKYELKDELGSGGYGFVMTAIHRNEGYEVAVKFVIKSKVPDHAWMEDEQIGRLPSEVMLLCFIEHPNIVKCLDLYEDAHYFYMIQELHGSPWHQADRSMPKQIIHASRSISSTAPSLTSSLSADSMDSSRPSTPPVSLFMNAASPVIQDNEKALETTPSKHLKPARPRLQYTRRPSYDLFECIEQSEHKHLQEDKARFVFSQVVDAVHYLDGQGVSHRDIKDENLVIDQDYRVKLIDFGSATVVDVNEPRPYYTLFYGTTAYASSEILQKKAYQAAPAEIWTLGVLLSYLLTGTSPFPTVKDAVDGRIVLHESSTLRLSRSCLHLMTRCLDPNPDSRATIAQVAEHPWLTGKDFV